MVRRSTLWLAGCLSVVALAACSSAPAERSASTSEPLSCSADPASGDLHYDQTTRKTIHGIFLEHWNATGGLAGSGHPTTEVFDSVGADGKTYQTQCFERRVFEFHPESSDCKYRVLGRHLGRQELARRYGDSPPNGEPTASPYAEDTSTGRVISQRIYETWLASGGIEENGRPITEELWEESNGMTVKVQYFERAVFEYHPENGAPYDILGRLLGVSHDACKAQVSVENPPKIGSPPGYVPIDTDGCGLDGKPTGPCNAGKVLAFIGSDPMKAADEAIGCGTCATALVTGGAAVVASDGALAPTATMVWGTIATFLGCRSCMQYLEESGTFSTLSCLADKWLTGGCEFDPVGADNACKHFCAIDFGEYGYIDKTSLQCNCTKNAAQMQCRQSCSYGDHIIDSRCKCEPIYP